MQHTLDFLSHTAVAPRRRAISATLALGLLTLGGCVTHQGATLAQVEPTLDDRAGVPAGATADAAALPWDQRSLAWEGKTALTPDAALRAALQNNRTLRRTLLEVQRRQALYRDAQLPPNPTLDLAIGAPLDMGAVPILVMVGQQIDWLWKRDAIVGEADGQLRTLLFDAAAMTVAAVVETRAAYIDTAGSTELLALSTRDMEIALRILRATEEAFAAGEARGPAVNEARMNLAEAQNRAMESENRLLVAKTRLLQAMGCGAEGVDWDLAAKSVQEAVAACGIQDAPQPEDDAALYALVRERRFDLRAAQARVHGVEARLALARANQWPAIMLGSGWDRDMNGDQSAMVELQATLPLFNQGQFRVLAAQAELEIARLDADALWQQAVVDARRALTAIATSEHHTSIIRETTLAAYKSTKQQLADAVAAGDRPAMQLWRSEHQENHILIQLASAQRDRALATLALERTLAGARLPISAGSMGAAGPSGGGMGTSAMGGDGSQIGALQTFEFAALEGME